MSPFKIVLAAAAALATVAFGATVHYHLPHGELVVLTGSDIMRFDNDRDGGAIDAKPDVARSRDVRLIDARTTDGASVRTYRNEDALFYLKFDSGSLNSEVKSVLLDQSKGEEIPVLAISYGWRIPFFSLYPNLISINRVPAGYVYFPWHALAVLGASLVFFASCAMGVVWAMRTARKAADYARETARQAAEGVADGVAGAAARAASLATAAGGAPTAPPPPRNPPPNISTER